MKKIILAALVFIFLVGAQFAQTYDDITWIREVGGPNNNPNCWFLPFWQYVGDVEEIVFLSLFLAFLTNLSESDVSTGMPIADILEFFAKFTL